ncbi:Branched-chain amino acid transport protein [Paenibacillus mucilaginosus 3016]|uniref:Branched-chain amino acid transport protein n=1 Tax=Paenibacillus mucilaginosus 3016 TaxID=1116391 RepID=H6NE71_9BACL|nr:AzlC family ABC transporter permease [Paenibacillus mucilaginosus]AFC33847.1 Branched-chain amino acid transport protein [Paenibacillus mucilaginosus 3016]WFA22231.1 branched-chain amino acid ABC transporter permease [Paenibacillus mucilaginosus]
MECGSILEEGRSADRPERSMFLQGVRDCVPTLLGYLSIGLACGVIGTTSGLYPSEILLLSTLLYAGSAQFVVAGMVAAGGSAAAVIVTVLFVNLRHLLLSAALAPYFRRYAPWKNAILGSQLTDETFGVAVSRLAGMKGRARWMLGLNITAHVNWIAANMVGAYAGAWIPDPGKYGLPYALPAMFVGLLVLGFGTRQKKIVDGIVAVSAGAVCVAAGTFLPGHAAVLAAIVVAAVIGMGVQSWTSD